jgi:transposase
LAKSAFIFTIKLVAIDPKKLPNDPEILQQIVVDLTRQLDKSQRLLQQLLTTRSGTRSEQLSPDQLRLFAQQSGIELATTAQTAEPLEKQQADDDGPPAAGNGGDSEGKKRGRQPLPGHLKRERLVHDLAERDKHCAKCHEDLRRIGEEVSERYEYVPAQMLVIEDACQKYACTCTVKTAAKPAQPIEKSMAGASVLAHVIVSKLADHLPVHRQTKIMRRFGVEISDQTMCGWMRQSAELLVPLYTRLKEFVLSSKVVGTDDTPVRVLDRELSHTRKGRIWPYVGDQDHPAIIYDYTPTRERAGPERFLASYHGYLQADAYVAYDSFFTNPARGLVEVGCWAHGRRHVYQARDLEPARMGAVLAFIAQLYAVEKRARRSGIRGEDLRLLREQVSLPVITQLHGYLRMISEDLLPKSEPGQAVAYLLKNWTALTRYLEDGDLPIDNNGTERSLRGVALGRNNWTFLGSDRGGRTFAILRSFVASCELLKLDPFEWLRDVLSRIPTQSIQQLDQLLPHAWATART